MKIYLISLFLIAICGFAACGNEKNETPSDDRDPVRATSVEATGNNSNAPAKSLAKIVAFGDSLTAGFGLSTAESYPSLLQKRLDAEGYHYEVINAGVSGDTSAAGVRRIDWALEGNVKIVILELGANDFLRGQPMSEMKKNLGLIIERAQAKGAKVVLAGMEAPPQLGENYRKEVHEAFPEVAKKYNISLIPFFLVAVAGNESLNQADGVHPNPAGTKLVAETVYQSLQPLLEK